MSIIAEYPLWTFYDYDRVVITRGETQEQALIHAGKSWPRGAAITMANFNPISAAKAYDKNHSPGWLYRTPKWLN